MPTGQGGRWRPGAGVACGRVALLRRHRHRLDPHRGRPLVAAPARTLRATAVDGRGRRGRPARPACLTLRQEDLLRRTRA